MIVKIDKSFGKDVKKIKSSATKANLLNVIEKLLVAEKLIEIENTKKLRGTKNFYRIKMGEYRIGLLIFNKKVELISFLHRKDIYKYFP